MNQLEKAKEIAEEAHSDQNYGDHPYTYHLEMVTEVLREFNITSPIFLQAAWLHDIVEDTDWTRRDIEEEFNPFTAEVVWRVTDEEGKNRKERKQKTYPKIKKSAPATAVKVADRIANVRACLQNNPELLEMYKDEHSEFHRHLYKEHKLKEYFYPDSPIENMWDELNELLDYEP